MFVCYSLQPISVQEVIEFIAVDLDDCMGLDAKRRLRDANDIRAICPSLLEFETPAPAAPRRYSEFQKVYIAHFSIKEYLESERIRNQRAAMFSLASQTAHLEIFQTLLLYQQELIFSIPMNMKRAVLNFPLGIYSSWLCINHYSEARRPVSIASDIISKLFQRLCSSTDLIAHRKAHDDISFTLRRAEHLVYYATALGLETALHDILSSKHGFETNRPDLRATLVTKLWQRIKKTEDTDGELESEVELDVSDESDVSREPDISNEQDVDKEQHRDPQVAHDEDLTDEERHSPIQMEYNERDNPLYVASRHGHENIVQFLLIGGADVHAKSRTYFPLAVASDCGHKKVVQMLLDWDSATYSSEQLTLALEKAARRNDKGIALLLLERGADVNGFGDGMALQLATEWGHLEMVEFLLDQGADVNSTRGYCGTALQEAAWQDNMTMVRLLLARGALVDLHKQDRDRYGTPLQIALMHYLHDSTDMVIFLLGKGADISLVKEKRAIARLKEITEKEQSEVKELQDDEHVLP